jgi:RNA polymerase sigma-70 factor (ECF subfamily)
VWVYRHQIDPEKDFKAFLFTMARNLSLNYFRGQRVRLDYIRESPKNEEEEDTPHDLFAAVETGLLVKLLVARMPLRRKQIFELSRFEGKSNEEIAALLRLKKNTVEKHLSFAMKDLRELLP